MGGSGSGRQTCWDKKTTVEECRQLDAARWMREGILRADAHHLGSWGWWDRYSGEQTASVGYLVNTTNIHTPLVRLFYTITRRNGEQIECDYWILLSTTRPTYGGLRWWFICPLIANDRPCRRRVQKLYLPSGGTYYGCRHCYDLTYTSSQESHKHDRWWKLIAKDTDWDWRAVRNVMERHYRK
jgi:hypothetical protein